jgi:cytoplasmic FMR1 interacting protein
MKQHVALDPFEDIWNEVNESTTLGQFRGKLYTHIKDELTADISAQFVYTSTTNRFVRARYAFKQRTHQRQKVTGAAPKPYFWYGQGFRHAYESLGNIYRGYFGTEHVEAILDVLKDHDIADLVQELVAETVSHVTEVLSPYAHGESSLLNVLPTMPMAEKSVATDDTGSCTNMSYLGFQLRFISYYITSFPPLRTDIFQSLREVGNNVAFFRMLDQVVSTRRTFLFQQEAFFLGILPNVRATVADEKTKLELDGLRQGEVPGFAATVEKSMQEISDATNPVDMKLMQDVKSVAQRAISAVAARLGDSKTFSQTRGLFSSAMLLLKQQIRTQADPGVLGHSPSQASIMKVTDAKDMQHLLSVCQFVYNMPAEDAKADNKSPADEVVFGEGFNWGIATLVWTMNCRRQFSILDYSYQMLRMNRSDPLPEAPTDRKVKLTTAQQTNLENAEKIRPFMESAERTHFFNERVLDLLCTIEEPATTAVPITVQLPVTGGKTQEKRPM